MRASIGRSSACPGANRTDPRRLTEAAERKKRANEGNLACEPQRLWLVLPTQLAFEPLAAQQPRLRRAYRRLSLSPMPGPSQKTFGWVLFISDFFFFYSPLILCSFFPTLPPGNTAFFFSNRQTHLSITTMLAIRSLSKPAARQCFRAAPRAAATWSISV